jgi:hypothetical protein
MLVLAEGEPFPVRVLEVLVDDFAKVTRVRIDEGALALPSLPPAAYPPKATTGVLSATPMPLEPAVVEEHVLGKVWDEESLQAFCAIQRWEPSELLSIVERLRATEVIDSGLLAFRQRLGCFGHNAPPYAQVNLPPVADPGAIRAILESFDVSSTESFRSKTSKMSDDVVKVVSRRGSESDDWDAHPRTIWQDSHGALWKSSSRPFDTFLERAVTNVVDGWVLFEHPSEVKAFEIERVGEQTLAEFAITARATGLRLKLTAADKDSTFLVRSTTAHVESAPLPLSPLPVLDLLQDSSVTPARGAVALQLDRMVLGLRKGQTLLLSGVDVGDDAQPSGVLRSEAVKLTEIIHEKGFSTLYFEKALALRYVRATVTLSANVASATHGQSVPVEVLGSGDAGARKQQFTLQKPPLTWIAAPTPNGRVSTLTLRVDGIAWTEVPSLYGVPEESDTYTLRTGDDGRTKVICSRLPTGTGNVLASYRSGLGLAGQVAAGSLTTLLSRPLGVKAVTNPLRATGAQDPESREDARRNAPVSVLTLSRVVSLLDYENFARAFAGVAKAQAVSLWDGQKQLIHISVAAADGTPLEADSALATSLIAAIAAASDGMQRVQVDGYLARYFRVEASLTVDPRLVPEAVLADAEQALRSAFGFVNRGFGQRVTSADVISVIQSVRGVIACNLVALVSLSDGGADAESGVSSVLPAKIAHFEGGSVVPAEIVMLSPTGVKLTQKGLR